VKDTAIGIALACALLIALFAASYWLSPVASPGNSSTPSGIEAGFVGVKAFGAWRLVCGAPQSPGNAPNQSASAAGKPAAIGRCRTILEYTRNNDPRQVALAVSFRFIKKIDALLLVVRIPPTAKKGDVLLLQIGQKGVRIPVAVCGGAACVAVATMGPAAQNLILGASQGSLILLPGKDGKRPAVRVPLMSLPPAIAAMRTAEG
jgi:Invasion associated locus B (IalB) protein